MSANYVCADCDYQFALSEAGDDPRCPKCMEPADDSALQSDIWRQWLFVFALLFVAGIAYVVFE
ncbi:MAG: hypothetical protein JRF54_12370 [Deltaproteobacteria bacterium]|nr:hypothetical protein [Deltaproteobacteria bacterium]